MRVLERPLKQKKESTPPYMVQLHKLVEMAQTSQYFHNEAILNFIERERKGAESVDKRRMNADKYDRTVSTKVEDLIANYNTNEHSAELAQQLITSPETFSKGDHKVVDLLLTVLIFENYTRPCALYNVTMEELEKAAPSKTLGKLCILVQEHKNPQDHGPQPIMSELLFIAGLSFMSNMYDRNLRMTPSTLSYLIQGKELGRNCQYKSETPLAGSWSI